MGGYFRYSFLFVNKIFIFRPAIAICMKYRSVYILFVAFLLFCKPAAFAAYRSKKAVTTAHVSQVSVGSYAVSAQAEKVFHKLSSHRPWPGFFGQRERPAEWMGIVAFGSGFLGLFLPGLNFAAILFGILGLHKGTRYRGLAVAGLILGILELFLFVFFETTFGALIVF
jgi:hypothetical protein